MTITLAVLCLDLRPSNRGAFLARLLSLDSSVVLVFHGLKATTPRRSMPDAVFVTGSPQKNLAVIEEEYSGDDRSPVSRFRPEQGDERNRTDRGVRSICSGCATCRSDRVRGLHSRVRLGIAKVVSDRRQGRR